MKLSSYFVLSTFLAIGNFAHAFIAYEQFYPAVIHLSGDKLSRVILYNFAFVLFLAFSLATLRFFIGTLRDLEVEQLIDTGRGFLADTILFLVFYSPTIDAKEVDTAYLVQFICRIIFMKVFHLIVQIRVSHMFEVGLPRFWVNVKLFSLMALLLLYDIMTLRVYYPLATRNSTFYAWIVFEALTMAVMLIATLCKYFIHLIDLRLENGWPAKSAYLFYVDLIGDVANMILFLIFMLACVVQNPSRLPIYMMADVLQVARQLTMRLKAFKKYRAITANMDQKFPNATAEEREQADSCIICRDSLSEGSKKLPCSHVFHLDCLKNWVVMQQSCPTCRAEIPANPPPIAQVEPEAAPAPVAPALPKANATPAKASGSSTTQVTTTHVTSNQLSTELENFFTSQFPSTTPTAEPSMSLLELSAGIAHAQQMASYMRSQQEFWMKQVEMLGGDTKSIISTDPPGDFPTLPSRLESAMTRMSSIAPPTDKRTSGSVSSTAVPISVPPARTVDTFPVDTQPTAATLASPADTVPADTPTSNPTTESVVPGCASELTQRADSATASAAPETGANVEISDSLPGDEELRQLRELQRTRWQSQNSN